MDVQEKKAFEIAFDNKLGARGCQFDLDEDGNYEDRETLCGWHMWLEAKAQTDQKIKSLLCDEHLKKCESPTGIFNSQCSDEEPCLICLAKQAKAQTVPEGFVLLKMEDLEVLRDSALEVKYASLNNDSDRIFSDIEDIQLSIERLIEAQEQD